MTQTDVEFAKQWRTNASAGKPITDDEWSNLGKLSKADLQGKGLQEWETKEEKTLMLFPYTWFEDIPNGLSITDINWKQKTFKSGLDSDDRRFGALAYGVVV